MPENQSPAVDPQHDRAIRLILATIDVGVDFQLANRLVDMGLPGNDAFSIILRSNATQE